ncbi:putative MFS transporter [Xylariomycetidae sp. FL2044]|nr:putative MFS transporter [Xylariomycetidae sp. FL2044]
MAEVDQEKALGQPPTSTPPSPSAPGSYQPQATGAADTPKARDYLRLSIPAVVTIHDARQYPRNIKHLVTGIVAFCGLATPLGSNIFLPVLAPAAKDLHTTPTVMNLSIAFYCLAVAITPMWWATVSESQGKRRTYVISFFFFIVFNVVAAVSTSAGMFIAMRLLAGGASAPVQALGAATVADLWELKERGRAMGIFLLGAMAGNVVGPIVGGALGSRWDWRSTQWLMAIYGGVIWLCVLLFLPETSKQRVSSGAHSEKSDSKKSVASSIGHFLISIPKTAVKPIGLIPLLRFPPILITVLYTSVNFAAYYYLMIVIQATFSVAPYSYSVIIVGVLYLPNAAGNIVAAVAGGRWTDRVMVRKAKAAGRLDEEGQKPKPQDALGFNIWLAGLLYPAALIVSGWTSEKHVVAVPLIANFFFAVGNMMVQNITTVTLTEFVPGRAAVGMALANLVRNTLGAVVVIVAQPVMDAIGVGWLSTIVGIICFLSCSSIYLMQKNADRWAKDMAEKLPQVS